jgi:hypothetical protein
MEVSPLSREVMLHKLNLYPLDYRAAFAFSIIPSPQPHGLALRLAFPHETPDSSEESYGFTTFRVSARVG